MSYPTTLGPWYVVQRLLHEGPDGDHDGYIAGMEYYSNDPDNSPVWVTEPKMATIFMSLQSAARIAEPEEAQVRVLFSKEGAKEFDRD